MKNPRFATFSILLLIAGVATVRSDDGLALEWQSVSDGLFSLVVTAKTEPVSICMVSSQGFQSVQMAPTDTYSSNTVASGPVILRPLCAIEVYDELGERVGRSPFDDLSLMEVKMKPPGYVLQLGAGDRLSLDRTYREKPFRIVVRLGVYSKGSWKEVSLQLQ